MHELISILKRHEGSGVSGNGRVWRIEGSSAGVNSCKTQLLDEICRRLQPFVCYDESPRDTATAGRHRGGLLHLAPARWGAGIGSTFDSGVSVVIDSFHDDEYWVIGLRASAKPALGSDAP
jgi:hypothetical protein